VKPLTGRRLVRLGLKFVMIRLRKMAVWC